MKQTRLLALLLCLALAAALPVSAAAWEETPQGNGKILILHTNDVHCNVADGMGYSGLAAYRAAMEGIYGPDYVTLVDAGDAVQGGSIGTVSRGAYLVDIMNRAGYDLAVPGNHEFDFGLDNFERLAERAQYPYLCCNLTVLRTGETVLEPYRILSYGETKVAYVGITAPEAFHKLPASYFQDEHGASLYSFSQGSDGLALYNAVQTAVDAARAEGADFVVAVGHLGEAGTANEWKASAVIANTTGIDVLIDGHSHEEIRRTAKNKAGEPVVWAQAGVGMEAIGKIVIDPATGAITSELVKGYAGKDGDMTAFIDGIMAEFQLELGVVVAQSEVALTCHDPATGERLIRRGETNLGDLCADAFRAVLEADIGLVNGGGIRGGIAIGEITKGDLLDVYTFSNSACLAEVTGRQLLDALEFGASRYPEESGGFLQVSGLSYTVDSTQPSSVVTNDRKEFVGVAGPYRVRDVMVGDRPLDLARTYTVAGNDYILKNSGDGYTMFGSNIRIAKDDVMLDSALLARYITETLGGRIGFDYADPYGQGRIVVLRDILFDFGDLDHTAWYAGAVRFCVERGLMAGAGEGRFVPNGVVTRGTVFQTLYNAEGAGRSPAEPSGRAGFSDVAGKWYEDAAHWAAQTGLAALPGDGRFHGDRPVTRAELATILARYAAWKGVDLSRGGTSMEEAADYDAIPGWALDGMSACFYNGIMTGKPGNRLDPNGGAVRTELATVLYHYGALAA